MEKKRIILSSNTAFSLYNFRLGLMRALRDKGFDVYAVAPYDKYADELAKEFSFIDVKHLDRKGKNPLKDIALFKEYYRIFKNIRPDLVINYTIKPNIYGSIAGKLLNIKTISVITGLGYVFVKGGILKYLVKHLYRISLNLNEYVIVMNKEDEKEIKDLLANANKVIVLDGGEGVNSIFFSPDFCQNIESKDKNVFLYIGRFLKDKGIIELVSAGLELYKKRKDFKIYLVGDIDRGNPASLSEEEIKEIKNYEFIEIIPFVTDVRPIICKASFVILPSYYREGVPRSLLEAMSMGKPIITTDSIGCRDVCIDKVNGLLVEPKSVKSLVDTMNRALDLSIEERKKMGLKGRKLVLERFDEKIVIKKMEDIIFSIFS